jgi:hypothetical protein
MKGQIEKVVLIVIAIMLITVGCGPNATQSTPNPSPTLVLPTQLPVPTATSAPSFPIGTIFKGNWTWEINADGSYNSKSELADEDGIYNVYNNQISIMGDYSSCLGIVGVYTWTMDGNMLILTPIDDQCTSRRNVTDGKWRYEP